MQGTLVGERARKDGLGRPRCCIEISEARENGLAKLAFDPNLITGPTHGHVDCCARPGDVASPGGGDCQLNASRS